MIHIVTRWLLLGLPEQDQKLSYNTCIASMLENNVLFSSSAARLASFPMRFFDFYHIFVGGCCHRSMLMVNIFKNICIDFVLGEVCLPVENGILDNYRVKRQLVNSWYVPKFSLYKIKYAYFIENRYPV